jgi:mannose-6-phosphate isomerase-like protein (cupin superfamily)
MKNDFLVKHLADIAPIACPCGESRRIITGEDTSHLSIHRVRISGEAKKHYHKTLTEYYVVLEGAGEIEINETLVAVESGDVLMIPPGTRHALRGEFEIINVVVPPFDPEDEYLVE